MLHVFQVLATDYIPTQEYPAVGVVNQAVEYPTAGYGNMYGGGTMMFGTSPMYGAKQ